MPDPIGAFGAEFGGAVTDENRSGSESLGWLGVCDSARVSLARRSIASTRLPEKRPPSRPENCDATVT